MQTAPQSASGAQRAPSSTAGPFLEFNLPNEIEQLRREPAWQSGRNARTIVKYSDFRIVLTAIKASTHIHEHHSDGRISVQTVAGHIRMRAAGKEFDMPVGRLLALDQAMPHEVDALEDSAFLLTIAWPGGERSSEARR